MRKRRILFAGFVARMGEERLPQRVMFRELVWGKGYSGGQEKDWLVHLKEDMSVFGMKFKGWRNTAQKAGRWFRRVEEGAEFFMRKWHKAERRRAAERHATTAAATSTVGIPKRPGEGGRGGVLPKRIKFGSGHHRLEVFWAFQWASQASVTAALTSSLCCVLLPVPLMHLIPSMSQMQS